MKHFKQLCATLALVIVLANATVAGEGVMYPWITPPPPPPSSPLASPVAGNIQEVSATEELTTDIALSLVKSLLTLF